MTIALGSNLIADGDSIPMGPTQPDKIMYGTTEVWVNSISVSIADVFSIDLWVGDPSDGIVKVVTGFDQTAQQFGLTWVKSRSDTRDHALFSNINGIIGQRISSNLSSGLVNGGDISAWNQDGYTLAALNPIVNLNPRTYVGWSFMKSPKFFDVIKYIGDGVVGREIPHALGVQAGMVFVKTTNTAQNWAVQHTARGSDVGQLNGTYDFVADPSYWDSTTMDDLVVTLGSSVAVNSVGNEYVMYVFAHDIDTKGVIQCGSYIGNSLADGPDISLGWNPQYVLIKAATGVTSGGWYIFDTPRTVERGITAESTVLEAVNNAISFNPDGFKVIRSHNVWNKSGEAYIYMAIREA